MFNYIKLDVSKFICPYSIFKIKNKLNIKYGNGIFKIKINKKIILELHVFCKNTKNFLFYKKSIYENFFIYIICKINYEK